MNTTNTRTCLRCKKTKNLSMFGRNPFAIDQLRSSCVACMDAFESLPVSPREEQAKVRKAEKERVKREANR